MKYHELAQTITNKIIEALNEVNPDDWHPPWKRAELAAHLNPTNYTTGQPYRGSNVFLLALDAMIFGWETGHWATYRQWQKHGAQVNKGETGTRLVRWVEKVRTEEGDGDDDEERRYVTLLPKIFTVFNIAQTSIADEIYAAEPLTAPEGFDAAAFDLWVQATGATIHRRGQTAGYAPEPDVIVLPSENRWTSVEGRAATIAHELTHWTGHKSRRNRAMGADKKSKEYAFEELVAELGSAIVTARWGIQTDEQIADHAQYIAGWKQLLAADPEAIMRAMRDATAAAEHLDQVTHPAIAAAA